MPNTVPAAATGLPDAPANVSNRWTHSRIADDFTGPAGQLIAVALAAQAAACRLEGARGAHPALQHRGGARG
jgi:hypothetical protein